MSLDSPSLVPPRELLRGEIRFSGGPLPSFCPTCFWLSPRGRRTGPSPGKRRSLTKRVDAVGLALALDQVDFSQTGSRLSSQREDLGGLTGTVEVLDSQATSPPSRRGGFFRRTLETGCWSCGSPPRFLIDNLLKDPVQ